MLFLIAILLGIAVAIPTNGPSSGDPWAPYLTKNDRRPNYDPPDLGGRDLPGDFFNDFPTLTPRQREDVRKKYRVLHDETVSYKRPFFYIKSVAHFKIGNVLTWFR